jgi:hypothetical protein
MPAEKDRGWHTSSTRLPAEDPGLEGSEMIIGRASTRIYIFPHI